MIHIIHEDDDLVVVNKPSGLLCVPGLSDPNNLFDQVKDYNPNARTVHRLDMGTSGLVIFAKHYEAQKRTSKLFEKREVKKDYIARVNGLVRESFGEIQSPMICDWPNRPKQMIHWLNGKQAFTVYRVLQRFSDSTLVKLFPHTGRTHQLRLHMLQIGHPILGDAFYHLAGSENLAERLLLHARKLSFSHPFTKQSIKLEAPADFE